MSKNGNSFTRLVNHIKPASELKPGTDYSLFKKGIRPMWEDVANKNGGRWLVSLEKKQRGPELNNCWLEVVSIVKKMCSLVKIWQFFHGF
jgi:translation initiation factor 4E